MYFGLFYLQEGILMAQKKDKKAKAPLSSYTPPAFLANDPTGQVLPPENQGHGAVPGSREAKTNKKHH